MLVDFFLLVSKVFLICSEPKYLLCVAFAIIIRFWIWLNILPLCFCGLVGCLIYCFEKHWYLILEGLLLNRKIEISINKQGRIIFSFFIMNNARSDFRFARFLYSTSLFHDDDVARTTSVLMMRKAEIFLEIQFSTHREPR